MPPDSFGLREKTYSLKRQEKNGESFGRARNCVSFACMVLLSLMEGLSKHCNYNYLSHHERVSSIVVCLVSVCLFFFCFNSSNTMAFPAFAALDSTKKTTHLALVSP